MTGRDKARTEAQSSSAHSWAFTGSALVAALLCAGVVHASPSPRPAASLSLIPWPTSVASADAGYTLKSGQVISVPDHDPSALFAANQLAARLSRQVGLKLRVVKEPSAAAVAAVRFQHDPSLDGDEAYRLEIDPHGVVLRARGDAGLYYAAMTLSQVAVRPGGARGAVALPGLAIADAPRFGWRGLLLDSARHYQSPTFIRRLIDQASALKLNVLQWHLTDDQAWRLEIKAYPRLTEVGGCRHEAGFAPAPAYCGVYSQAEVRELVAYAAQRHVRIVPEIDAPGHASAAVAAYPELGAAPPTRSEPENRWGVFKTVYSPSEKTIAFLDAVYEEVTALFPGAFVHIGGDEVVRRQWQASPEVQARMKALGVADEKALQGWFAAHLAQRLALHGRRAIGWDEILEGGAPPESAIMSWRGVYGADQASAAGHDVVLSPAPTLYLDNRQDDLGDEPPGRGHVTRLSDVYGFDPASASLSPAQRAHVLGVQANIWTEHLRTEARVERAAFPRAAALAEVGWSAAPRRPLADFEARLLGQFDRFKADGTLYSATWFQPRAQITRLSAHQVEVALSKPASLGQVRYALGGAPVRADSPMPTGPLRLALPSRLQMANFDGDRRLSAVVRLDLSARTLSQVDNHGLALCTNGLTLNLEGEPRRRGGRGYLADILNPCWIWKGASLDGVRRLSGRAVPLPYNFALGADDADDPTLNVQKLSPPRTAHGELEASLDRCDGPVIAVLPLSGAAAGQRLSGSVTAGLTGLHDICLKFTGIRPNPMWVPDRLRLSAGRPGRGRPSPQRR